MATDTRTADNQWIPAPGFIAAVATPARNFSHAIHKAKSVPINGRPGRTNWHLHSQTERNNFAIGAASFHVWNPVKPDIHHDVGFSFPCFDEVELDRGFTVATADADFLRAGQLFVLGESLQRIAE